MLSFVDKNYSENHGLFPIYSFSNLLKARIIRDKGDQNVQALISHKIEYRILRSIECEKGVILYIYCNITN